MSEVKRCQWPGGNELYLEYHDEEWGRPLRDDRGLFEFLTLETMQAGLSWITVLKKRERFKEVFDDFDPKKVASYNQTKIDELLADPGIIRNRMKIEAAINNAQIVLDIPKERSFADYIWSYVDNRPIINHFTAHSEVPPSTDLSDKMSKQMKKDGFKFLGTTTVYAFMQAVGMVDDHMTYCFCHTDNRS